MVADVSALYLVRVGEQTFVRRGTPAVTVTSAMHGVKADPPPDPRDAAELRLMADLEALFRTLAPDVADMLAKGQMPSDKELGDAFAAVIRPRLVETAMGEMARLSNDVGIGFDATYVNQEMIDWARTYTYELVKGINETTLTTLRSALSEFASTPGMTRKQLEALIEPAFGKLRAEMISVTETTRANSRGQMEYQRQAAEAGISMERVWRTIGEGSQAISHVCDICYPLNGKPESVWKGQHPSGPPAHVKCRCRTTLRSVETP